MAKNPKAKGAEGHASIRAKTENETPSVAEAGVSADAAERSGLDPETGLPPADNTPVPAPYSQRPPRQDDVRPREASAVQSTGTDSLEAVDKEIRRIEALSRVDPKAFWNDERMNARSLIDQLNALVARLQKLNLS